MSKDLVKPQERPSFLSEATKDTNTEAMREYVSISMVKLVQKMSDSALIEKFGVGQPILTPELIPIQAPFEFTPIYFYPQWILWAPMKSGEGILSSTTDSRSEMALKSKSSETWSEARADGKGENRYVEHLNFISILPSVSPLPVVLSFARAEHRTGKRLVNLITMRNAPSYSCRFSATPAARSNSSGEWYGLDIDNAPEPWVSEEEFNAYTLLQADMQAARERIKIDHELVENPSDAGSDFD